MPTESWSQALAAWQDGRYDEAGRRLEDLLVATADDLQARHLYGVVKVETGDYEEAIRQLQLVCRAEPENDQALSNLGNAQRLAGRFAEAEISLRSGLTQNPANPTLHFNLAVLLNGLKRAEEAEAAFLRSCELDPDDQASWLELGQLRYARSDHLNAAAAFLRAAESDGEHRVQAIRSAGFALADGGRPEQAAQLLSSLCPERPEATDDFHLLSQLLYCRMETCDWRGLHEAVARCKQFIAEGRTPVEPFSFRLLPGISGQDQLALTSNFVRGMVRNPLVAAAVARDRDPARRLRIGYLSADFHDHAVMRLIAGVLEHHDHVEHEIHGFSYGASDDGEMRRRLVASCDCFHEVSLLSLESLAQRIREEGVDILVDLTGWTGNTRSAVLALRPAPIQVNFLGYTGTLGSRVLADYLIGDPIATPLADQCKFAETLALMPVCCQPNDSSRRIGTIRTREEEGLPAKALVFCCFSRPLKITPQIFDCWCDLLGALPESVLWLLATNETARANLVAFARRRGIDPARLVFSAARPPDEHLARLALADLALDTFPFGAHTTASDALWAGLPVITLVGETFPSRVTASMLNAIGLNELATRSIEEYRALGLALGHDAAALAALRTRLGNNRLSSRLFDTRQFAVELEALLRAMWRNYCLDAK